MRLLQGLQHRPRLLRAEAGNRQPDLDSRGSGRGRNAAALEGFRRLRLRKDGRAAPAGGPEQRSGWAANDPRRYRLRPECRIARLHRARGGRHDRRNRRGDADRADEPERAGLRLLQPPGSGPALTPASHGVTQDIEGAADLDILPCTNGKTVRRGQNLVCCRIPHQGDPDARSRRLERGLEGGLELLAPDETRRRSSRSPPGASRSCKRQPMPRASTLFG